MKEPVSGTETIISFLQGLDGRDVCFCPNPGNAGDSAIALGAYRLFDRMGRSYETVRWDEDFDSTGETLIYGGGGNLAASYPQAATFIERHHRRAEKLIVFPHTVQGNEDLLSQLGGHVDIFCRERRSFDLVTQQAPKATVYLADDLAFSLDVGQLLADSTISSRTLAQWILGRPLREAIRRLRGKDAKKVALRPALKQGVRALFRMVERNTDHLYAMRTDRERVEVPVPRGNVDVSRVFPYGTAPRAAARRATLATLTYLDQFDRITTNRLHICILAALLGKEVEFYANSYFKNEAVYRYSIEGRFPRVQWCGQWEKA